MIMDSSDWLMPECLVDMVETMRNTGADIVRTGYYYMKSRGMVPTLPHLENGGDHQPLGFAELYSPGMTISEDPKEWKQYRYAAVEKLLCYHRDHEDSDNYSIPRRIVNKGLYILERIGQFPCKLSNSKKIRKLQGEYSGKRCFIIGNGPSLTVEDVNALRNEYTFGVNKINKIFDKTEWRPTFYVVSDVEVLRETKDILEAISAKYLFFRISQKHMISDAKGNYLFFDEKNAFYGNHPGNFSMDASKTLYTGGTVAYECIQLAVYMGFTEIYLIGMDHSFSVASTKTGMIFGGTGGHFDDNYFKEGQTIMYARPDIIEEAYSFTLAATNKMKIHIYNATRGGHLESFQRVDLDEVLSIHPPEVGR